MLLLLLQGSCVIDSLKRCVCCVCRAIKPFCIRPNCRCRQLHGMYTMLSSLAVENTLYAFSDLRTQPGHPSVGKRSDYLIPDTF